eukprot:Skav211937  [mRNA]  locus=scaffold1086:563651:568933:- [translate_table: standard]
MGLIARDLMQHAGISLRAVPQFAYQPSRGCGDAIERLAAHCLLVRDTLDNFRLKHHRAATAPPPLFGGLLFSLDLSKAFDRVDREKLLRGMGRLGIPSHLLDLLATIYQHTTFTFEYQNHHRTVSTHQGIRQGCKAAPCCWALFITDLLHQLMSLTNDQWVLRDNTVYADDWVSHNYITSVEQFHQIIRWLGLVLDLLEDNGMQPNLDKTKIMLSLGGRALPTITKRYIRRTRHGAFLCIPRRNGTCQIQIVSQIPYLGVQLHYRRIESATMDTRLQSAKTATALLHKWLFTRQPLRLQHRIRVWRQCVLPCHWYGLFQVGFHFADIIRLDQHWMKQLRGITHTPAHLTKISNIALLHRYAIPDPLLQLRQLGLNLQASHTQRITALHPTDILHQQPACRLSSLITILDQCIQARRHPDCKVTDLHPGWSCPHCDLSFSDQSQLRRHLTIAHDQYQGSLRAYHLDEAQAGEPTCVRCGHRFTSWHSLKYHIQFVCTCARQELAPTMDPVQHLHVELRRYLAANLYNLHLNEGLCDQLTQCCCLCYRLCEGDQGLFRHWNQDHPKEWTRHGQFLDQVEQASLKTTPCAYCKHPVDLSHQCIVHRQLAMLLAYDRPGPSPESSGDRLHQCHCGKAYVTAHGLKQRQTRAHSQTSQVLTAEDRELILTIMVTEDWQDILDNQRILTALTTGCLLCEQQFSRRSLLTRHLRQAHSHHWNEAVNQAYQLEALYKEAGTCYCDPQLPGKHSCVIFQQLALLQRHWADTCQEDQSPPLPPQVAPAPLRPPAFRHMIEVALKLGSVDVLLQSRIVKYQLSTRCILCNSYHNTFEELIYHYSTQHPNAWQDREPFLTLLLHTIFQTKGCTCWPTIDAQDHICVTLAQIAVVAGQMSASILLPFRFSALEHAAKLSPWLPTEYHEQMMEWLLTRDFGSLIQADWLHATLQTGCIICGQAFLADDLAMHVWNHHVSACLHASPVMALLADHLMTIIPDTTCPLCNMPLTEDSTQGLFDHLRSFCPVILQISYVLTLPNQDHAPYADVSPPVQQRRSQVHRRQLTLVDGMVRVLEADEHQLITTWLKLIQHLYVEPSLMQFLACKCWQCHQLFLTPSLLIDHINQYHAGLRSQTRTCLATLAQDLPTSDLCTLCCLPDHPSEDCPVLLQLATLLCDDGGKSTTFWPHAAGDHGMLETHYPARPIETYAGLRKRSCRKHAQEDQNEASKRSRQGSQQGTGQGHPHLTGAVPTDDSVDDVPQQTCSSTRGLPECSAVGTAVPDSLQDWRTGNPSHPPAGIAELDTDRFQNDATETPPGSHHHPTDDRAPRVSPEARCPTTDQGHGSPAAHHGLRRQDAFSPVESKAATTGTVIESDANSGEPSPERAPILVDGYEGCGDNYSIPFIEEGAAESNRNSVHSMDLDDLPHRESHHEGHLAQTVLSCSLATYRSQVQTSEPGTFSGGKGDPISHHGHPREADARLTSQQSAIRVLMNPHATCCFANAPTLGLTWQTLLLSDVADGGWLQGQQLYSKLTSFTLQPFYLVEDAEFRAVLRGHWKEFDSQLDALEFTETLLLTIQPKLLSNAWSTQTSVLGLADGTALEAIKSPDLVPIQLNVFAIHAPTCTLHQLIELWHDAAGHPKGLLRRSHSVVLSLPRTADDATARNSLEVTACDHDIELPFFADDSGSIQFQAFTPVAITFHIGTSALQGHFRTALRTKAGWKAYEDNRAPDQWPTFALPEGAQVVLVWAIRADHWLRAQSRLMDVSATNRNEQ